MSASSPSLASQEEGVLALLLPPSRMPAFLDEARRQILEAENDLRAALDSLGTIERRFNQTMAVIADDGQSVPGERQTRHLARERDRLEEALDTENLYQNHRRAIERFHMAHRACAAAATYGSSRLVRAFLMRIFLGATPGRDARAVAAVENLGNALIAFYRDPEPGRNDAEATAAWQRLVPFVETPPRLS